MERDRAERQQVSLGGIGRRDLVKAGVVAMATGVGASLVAPRRALGNDDAEQGRPLVVVGNGPFTFGVSTCDPDLASVVFPARLIDGTSGKDGAGQVTINTCCRAAPGGNTNLLVNVNETVIELGRGRSITASVTTYGAVVFGGVCGAPEPAPSGLVNLALYGDGEVTAATGVGPVVGAKIFQSGSAIEEVIAGDPTLGTALLRPVQAMNIVYLINL